MRIEPIRPTFRFVSTDFLGLRLPLEEIPAMALPDTYIQVYGQLSEVFKRIADGQAPDKFTRQYLRADPKSS
jgi:hypothetical protein